jgi:hypothetical protein
MKQNIIFLSVLIGMSATVTLFTGCSRPTQREAKVNSKIAANLFVIADLPEVTGKEAAVHVQGGKKDLKLSADAKLSQTKLEGSATEKIFKKVTKDETKAALAEQLKTGAVAIVVLDDQIKIMKVVADTTNSVDTRISSLAYLAKMKQLVKASDKVVQQSLKSELEILQYQTPAELGEKFGLVEITALKIEKHGILDNEKTDYNEAKSILNVVAKPFELSTHIIVGEEISSGSAEASAQEKSNTQSAE